MIQINRTALVLYSAKQMYQLVNDVQSYPEFIPGCISGRVLESSQTHITAVIGVSKGGIGKTFTTRNTLMDNKSILLHLIDGPFKNLVGDWKFTSLSVDTCYIKFHLDFEFTNKLIELAFGPFFNELALNMVQVFTIRAKELYGVL